jgi:hypothetical protein
MTAGRFTFWSWMILSARPSPAAIRVPPLNEFVHGLTGNCGRNPFCAEGYVK